MRKIENKQLQLLVSQIEAAKTSESKDKLVKELLNAIKTNKFNCNR